MGNLSTIFESYSYPLIKEELLSRAERETSSVSTIETKSDLIPFLNKELNCIPIIEIQSDHMTTIKLESNSTSAIKEEVALMSTVNAQSYVSTVVEKGPSFIPETEEKNVVTEERPSAPSIELQPIVISPTGDKSSQDTENLYENNPVFSSASVIKKKKFRIIRKFFCRLCCIRGVTT